MTTLTNPLVVSIFKHKLDNKPQRDEIDGWDDFVEALREASEQPREVVEKDGIEGPTKPDGKRTWIVFPSCPAVCPAEYAGALRRKAEVLRWHYFAADVDNEDADAMLTVDDAEVVLRSFGLRYVLHSSTKSKPHQHRYRMILPVSRPIEAHEYEQVWASVNDMFACIFDAKTRDPSRLFFVPARWDGSFWFFRTNDEGQPLDIDKVVMDYPVAPAPAPAATTAVPLAILPQVTTQLAEARAKLLGATHLSDITDALRSPFVTDKMRDDYRTKGQGGRFFSFMVSAAMSALAKGYSIAPAELEALGLSMDRLVSSRVRYNTLYEAQRALAFAAAKIAEDDPEDRRAKRVQNITARIQRKFRKT